MMAEKVKEEKKKDERPEKKIVSRIKKAVASKKEPDEAGKTKPDEIAVADPFDTLKFVLMTEKAIQLIETQNKLVFIVRRNSTKDDIKNAAESAFKSPIKDVQTLIDQKSRKKAFIKFAKEGDAGEIAIRLGII